MKLRNSSAIQALFDKSKLSELNKIEKRNGNMPAKDLLATVAEKSCELDPEAPSTSVAEKSRELDPEAPSTSKTSPRASSSKLCTPGYVSAKEGDSAQKVDSKVDASSEENNAPREHKLKVGEQLRRK